jgi:hypothetical protein
LVDEEKLVAATGWVILSGCCPATGVAGTRKRGNNSYEFSQKGTGRREFQNPSRTFRMSNA